MKIAAALNKAEPDGTISSEYVRMLRQTRDSLVYWLLEDTCDDKYKHALLAEILLAKDWEVDKEKV